MSRDGKTPLCAELTWTVLLQGCEGVTVRVWGEGVCIDVKM